MLRTIAIDDEMLALDIVKSYAERVDFIDLKNTFVDAFKALEYLETEKIDLIFLDIKMPDISGLEFLRKLPEPPMVVFTTAYSDYAVKSYDYEAIDYLLKVFSFDRFLKACHKALDAHSKADAPSCIFVKDGYEKVKILLNDILYVEAQGNYVQFVTKNRKTMSRMTMNEALALLPPERFVRIHKSFIISELHIEKIDAKGVVICEKAIPFGKGFGRIV